MQEKQNKVLTGTKVEVGNLVANALVNVSKQDQAGELALLQVIIPQSSHIHIYQSSALLADLVGE